MRSTIRTIVVLALAALLVGLFLQNVDLRGVGREILRAEPVWLLLSLASMFSTLALRAWRWQYLLEPLGHVRFDPAFRATCVGFAANTLLPARAGEVIRPYFLARRERISATGAFATIILERVLDTLTVLVLLAAYVFVFGRDLAATNPAAFGPVKWAGATAAAAALAALVFLFVLAGHPTRLREMLERLERVLPSRFVGLVAHVVEKFASGLVVVRRPRRLFVSLVLSFPLWASIAMGIWTVARAFHLPIPITGSFLIMALLVIGVAVPTPGAVGGFHWAFLFAATTFFGASEEASVGAAVVLHVFSFGPALLLGLFFAAQEGLNFANMRQLAAEPAPEHDSLAP
jgi:hypothetical protein